jgi:hypothetical protein
MSDEPLCPAEFTLMKNCVAQLSEHFDSVRIVATRHANGSTAHASWGSGNWYAQKASVEEWLLSAEARTQAQVTQDVADEDNEESI